MKRHKLAQHKGVMSFVINVNDTIDYEVTADSMEQIEAKQYPCDECEYNVKY